MSAETKTPTKKPAVAASGAKIASKRVMSQKTLEPVDEASDPNKKPRVDDHDEDIMQSLMASTEDTGAQIADHTHVMPVSLAAPVTGSGAAPVVASGVAPVFPTMLYAAIPLARFVVDAVARHMRDALPADDDAAIGQAHRTASEALARLLHGAPVSTSALLDASTNASLDWRDYLFINFVRRISASWDALSDTTGLRSTQPHEARASVRRMLHALAIVWSASADMFAQDSSKHHLATEVVLMNFIDALARIA